MNNKKRRVMYVLQICIYICLENSLLNNNYKALKVYVKDFRNLYLFIIEKEQ